MVARFVPKNKKLLRDFHIHDDAGVVGVIAQAHAAAWQRLQTRNLIADLQNKCYDEGVDQEVLPTFLSVLFSSATTFGPKSTLPGQKVD